MQHQTAGEMSAKLNSVHLTADIWWTIDELFQETDGVFVPPYRWRLAAEPLLIVRGD